MIFMIFYTFLNENSKHAEQHEAACGLLSEGVKRLYGITSYTLKKGEHGKPFFKEYPDIKFNISHCSGLAVCGISGGEIGVDAELIRPYNGKVMRRIFSESEQNYILFSENSERDFFRFWTLKECFGKAIGVGIFSDLKNYSFEISDDIEKNPKCEKIPDKIFTQKIIQKKWVVSVCADRPENEFEFIDTDKN